MKRHQSGGLSSSAFLIFTEQWRAQGGNSSASSNPVPPASAPHFRPNDWSGMGPQPGLNPARSGKHGQEDLNDQQQSSSETTSTSGPSSKKPEGWVDQRDNYFADPTKIPLSPWKIDQSQDALSAQQEIDYSLTWFGKLTTNELQIDKKLTGIPFKISDEAALDAVQKHHRTAVEPISVDRYMLPFWLLHTQVNGSFSADVKQKTKTTGDHWLKWFKTPTYDFSYPRGDHLKYNQMSASYLFGQQAIEEVVSGDHVPSMLLERYELLESIEEMRNPPTLLPFQSSTDSAVKDVGSRVTKERVEYLCHQQLKKYHKGLDTSVIHWKDFNATAYSIRPAYLPVFKLEVLTKENKDPLPAFVCGATGNTKGPVIFLPRRKRLAYGSTVAAAATAVAALGAPPMTATLIGLGSGFGVQPLLSHWRYSTAKAELVKKHNEPQLDMLRHQSTNQSGWRWSAEEEEKAEFEYREDLRAKARRRARFEQRVREESGRDEAMRQGKAWKADADAGFTGRRRSEFKYGQADLDPLHYYRILGLTGQEQSCTKEEISKAFRAAAAKAHPDLIQDEEKKEAAHKQMQSLLEAYNVLRDKKLRKEYDSGVLTASNKR